MKSGDMTIASPLPNKSVQDKDETHMGVIYIMTEIEPAYYLVVSQLVVHRDLRQASIASMKSFSNQD